MVNEIMQLMENEAFFSWAVISIFVLLSIVAVIFIVTRIILYERRKVDERVRIGSDEK